MPIQISELNISVSVTPAPSETNTPTPAPGLSAAEIKKLVDECTDQVEKTIRDKKER